MKGTKNTSFPRAGDNAIKWLPI